MSNTMPGGRTVYDLNLKIVRIGRHRKGDSVRLTLKHNTPAAAAEALKAFARNYLVTAKFEVFVYTDGTFGIGSNADNDEEFGSGTWEITTNGSPAQEAPEPIVIPDEEAV